MKQKTVIRRLRGALVPVLFLALCSLGRADGVDVNSTDIALNPTLLEGVPGTTLTFGGTLTDLDFVDDPVFYNGAGINLTGFDPTDEDTSPFFANAPLFLDS